MRTGLQEYEIGAEVPVWLPGESRALRGSIESQATQLDARVAQLRLQFAGEVRDAYWLWSAALAEREAANARVVAARALKRDLARQVAAGQVPRADLLLAVADLREAEASLVSAAGAVRGTAGAYRTLTGGDPTSGQPERPAPPPTGEAALRSLPAAVVARTSADLARAEERLARIRDRPVLFGGVRRERDGTGAPYSDSVVVGLRIPFAYAPTMNERVATARAEATLADADRRARAAAEDAAAIARLADGRHRAPAEQSGLSEAAYRAGNLPFAELVRVRASGPHT